MTDDHDALRDRMRAADPAASLPPADDDRVRGLLEQTTAHGPGAQVGGASPGEPGPGRRWPFALAVAAAAALVLGGVAVGVALTGGDEPGSVGASGATTTASPSAGTDPSGETEGAESGDRTALSLSAAAPPATARCRAVTAEGLRGMETAFLGTVTAVDDETVTLEVERWYTGGDVDVVEVLNPPAFGVALEGQPELDPGRRFLITAVEGRVTACGFSAPYSEGLERMFLRAFS